MPQAVRRSRSAFSIDAKTLFVEDGFEKLALPLGKDEVSGFRHTPLFAKGGGSHGRFWGRVHAINARRAKPASKSLKRPHCTGHTRAISDAALSAYFNLQDRLAQILVINDRDISELKTPSLSGRSPVLTANSTKSCSCFASQLKPFFSGSFARCRVAV
jgi:hypothetical protein